MLGENGSQQFSIFWSAISLAQFFVGSSEHLSSTINLPDADIYFMLLLGQWTAAIAAVAFFTISYADRVNKGSFHVIDLISITVLITVLSLSIGKTNKYVFERASLAALNDYQGIDVQLYNPQVAYLNGAIGNNTLTSLLELIKNNNLNYLELDSDGGLISTAVSIGETVNEEGITTVVRRNCASACVIIALSSNKLLVAPDAQFGFHNASSIAKNSSQRGRLNSKVASDAMFNFLTEKGVPSTIIDKAKLTPAGSIYNVTGQNFIDLGLANQLQ